MHERFPESDAVYNILFYIIRDYPSRNKNCTSVPTYGESFSVHGCESGNDFYLRRDDIDRDFVGGITIDNR